MEFNVKVKIMSFQENQHFAVTIRLYFISVRVVNQAMYLTLLLCIIYDEMYVMAFRAVARTLCGVCIFIYLGSARLTSFEINFISKETSRAELRYMNIPPPPQSVTL